MISVYAFLKVNWLHSEKLSFNFLIAKTYYNAVPGTISLYYTLSLLKQLPVGCGGRQVTEISEKGALWRKRLRTTELNCLEFDPQRDHRRVRGSVFLVIEIHSLEVVRKSLKAVGPVAE